MYPVIFNNSGGEMISTQVFLKILPGWGLWSKIIGCNPSCHPIGDPGQGNIRPQFRQNLANGYNAIRIYDGGTIEYMAGTCTAYPHALLQIQKPVIRANGPAVRFNLFKYSNSLAVTDRAAHN